MLLVAEYFAILSALRLHIHFFCVVRSGEMLYMDTL
jgi:hypothetical protein